MEEELNFKLLQTTQGHYVFVKLPDNVVKIHDSCCNAILTTHDDGYVETYYPLDNISIYEDSELGLLFKVSNVTLKDACNLLDEVYNSHGEMGYRQYMWTNEGIIYDPAFITPEVSFNSLLEYLEINEKENWHLFQIL